jgi:hypothetical protein
VNVVVAAVDADATAAAAATWMYRAHLVLQVSHELLAPGE